MDPKKACVKEADWQVHSKGEENADWIEKQFDNSSGKFIYPGNGMCSLFWVVTQIVAWQG